MKIYILFGLLIVLLGVPVLRAQNAGGYTALPCPFELPAGEVEGETMECGVVTVPESRTGLSDANIELALVILYAAGEETIPPMIYLAGGPGNSGTAAAEDFYDDPIRSATSIIFLDQRGTGYSQPSLDCDDEEEEADCYNRLVESGIVLDAYRNAENAADVKDVISALGLDAVTLYGISYGTRLALTVMKDPHPALYSVILDGVYPPAVYGYEEDASNIARVFSLIFEQCVQDEACNAAYPDLEEVFYATYESLNSDPLYMVNADDEEKEITGDVLIDYLFSSFYSTANIPYAPYIIYAAYNRDSEGLTEFFADEEAAAPISTEVVLRQAVENDGNSEGMFNNFECADEMPFNRPDAIAAAAAEIPMPAAWQAAAVEDALATISTCEVWVVEPSDPNSRANPVSAIPTLILNGEFDPVTPPHWAEIAAETLSNSYLYIIPAGGHGVINMTDCTAAIAFQFLTDPMSEPDASCIGDMPPPAWYVG